MKIVVICLAEYEPLIRGYYGDNIDVIIKSEYMNTDNRDLYFSTNEIILIENSDLIVGANNSEELEYLSRFKKPIISISATNDKSYDFNVYRLEYSDKTLFDIIFTRLYDNTLKTHNEEYFYDNILLVVDSKNEIYKENIKKLFIKKIRRYLNQQRSIDGKAVRISNEEFEEYILEVDETNIVQRMNQVERKIIIFSAYNYTNLLFFNKEKNNLEETFNEDNNNLEDGIIVSIGTGFTDKVNMKYYENMNMNIKYKIYNTSYNNIIEENDSISRFNTFGDFDNTYYVYLQYVLDEIYDINDVDDIPNILEMIQDGNKNNYYLLNSDILLSVYEENCYGISLFDSFDIVEYSEISFQGFIYNIIVSKIKYTIEEFKGKDFCIWIGPYNTYVVINNVEDEYIYLPFYGRMKSMYNYNKTNSV